MLEDKEEEVECLQMELRDWELRYQGFANSMEYELGLKV
jgi:hypothetical protein